ncbi:pyridoxamine 5'-phosphate oxidase family protein [Pseudonocardia sp. N23]|uniref:pyridoxamine 5'-phosphate oxidase family protein n=1 Tax=Pseudonocardia sp. N23 TaxID=1987376 RepID=UPI00155A0409|nr:pyridoxamine 5'-phosphate oxidase family protein [Pseudonocardia sp. N23]
MSDDRDVTAMTATPPHSSDPAGPAAGEGVMDAMRCRALLGAGTLGRIVYTRGALPECRPVAYTWEGSRVVFAIEDPAVARAIVANGVAAFETDGVDDVAAVAWTVLAVGGTAEIRSELDAVRLRRRLHGVWAGGSSSRMLSLRPRRLSGVRVELR